MVLRFVLLLLSAYQFNFTTGIYNGGFVGNVEVYDEYDEETKVFQSYSKEFPYMVEIVTIGHVCGGSLIRFDVVLTAAHCFPENKTDLDITQYKLLAGNQIAAGFQDPMVQVRDVISVVQHQGYPLVQNRDIALVRTDRSFDETIYVKTVNLPTGFHKNSFSGENVFQIGWGDRIPHVPSDVLQVVQGHVLPTRGCALKLQNKWHEHNLLCIKGYFRGIACFGDSGSPLVIHNKYDPTEDIVIGLSTSGFTLPFPDNATCMEKKPYVVANVAVFLDWINDTIINHL